MAETDIRNLSDVLIKHIGSGRTITDTKIGRLTAFGENYGSIMLKVDLSLKNDTTQEEILHLVAKKIPRMASTQEIFNIQVTFKNEVAFYEVVVPTLVDFQRKLGVTDVLDCFAKYYGARISLNESSAIVDEDAVLLLENLKISGFENADRVNGFDLETTMLVLKSLAEFHGTGLALKIKKPQVFDDKAKRYCHDFQPPDKHTQFLLNVSKAVLREDPECAPLIENLKYWGQEESQRKSRETFATITHCDLWVNNTLQKFENGRAVANKFVDFQVYAYRSLVVDVFFLLFTSVQQRVLEKHLDGLLKYYHNHLQESLKKLKCDTTPFTYDNFIEDITFESRYESPHALHFLMFVVHAGKASKEFDGDVSNLTIDMVLKRISEETKLTAFYVVKELHKRGWLH